MSDHILLEELVPLIVGLKGLHQNSLEDFSDIKTITI
jgi:hypothetical protein